MVLGDTCDAHFEATAQWLARHLACRFHADAAAALAAPRDGATGDGEPSLLVLLQSRPGEFTENELTALRSRWPLARIVSIAASWCEGEPRSGHAAAGVYRIAWQTAVERLDAEIHGSCRGSANLANQANGGLFELPATATVDERLLANARVVANAPGVVAVAARRPSWAEPIVDALATAGHAALFWPLDRPALVRGVDAVVWDTFGCDRDLAGYRGKLPVATAETPVVAVADFPRPHDVALLAELRVRGVLRKPYLVSDLLRCLDDVLAKQAPAAMRWPAVA